MCINVSDTVLLAIFLVGINLGNDLIVLKTALALSLINALKC
jgi:hypothetical protein